MDPEKTHYPMHEGVTVTEMLVLYYSLEGNTRFIAEAIADQVGADILALKPKRELGKLGGLRYAVGGFQALFGFKPALHPLDVDPQAYDVLFVGTPVWAGRYNPALRSLFATTPLTGKKIALFATCADSGQTAFEGLVETLAGNEILGQQDFPEVLQNREESESKARTWAQAMVERLA